MKISNLFSVAFSQGNVKSGSHVLTERGEGRQENTLNVNQSAGRSVPYPEQLAEPSDAFSGEVWLAPWVSLSRASQLPPSLPPSRRSMAALESSSEPGSEPGSDHAISQLQGLKASPTSFRMNAKLLQYPGRALRDSLSVSSHTSSPDCPLDHWSHSVVLEVSTADRARVSLRAFAPAQQLSQGGPGIAGRPQDPFVRSGRSKIKQHFRVLNKLQESTSTETKPLSFTALTNPLQLGTFVPAKVNPNLLQDFACVSGSQ